MKINTQIIYKSVSPKYSDNDIYTMAGTTSFVSFNRLKEYDFDIPKAIGLKSNEQIIGMKFGAEGINVIIETLVGF